MDTTSAALRGESSATLGTECAAAPTAWSTVEVTEIAVETPSVKTIRLAIPGWRGHVPGQNVDVQLTAEDGQRAQRSYSIASAPKI